MSNLKVLGLPDTATIDDIKTAWRKLATIHHPDKGGDGVKFDALRKAYVAAIADIESAPCQTCLGRGRIQKIAGWVSISLPCPTCQTQK